MAGVTTEYLYSTYTKSAAKRQKITKDGKTVLFESYDTKVAKINEDGSILIGKTWDETMTTRRYIYQFLAKYANKEGMNKDKMVEMFKDGSLTLVDKID